MAKKHKIPAPDADEAPALTHNPFGALTGGAASDPPLPATAPAGAAVRPNQAQVEIARGEERPGRSHEPRGRLILRREKKRRGGKTVVVISGLGACPGLDAAAIRQLAHDLKQQLGCGGSVETAREPEIVLQGDQPARVAELLRARGFRVSGVVS